MALHERSAIGMPPDGVGKHFNVDYAVELTYQSATGTFVVGHEVTGGTSALTGQIVRVQEHTLTTGQLYLILLPSEIGSDFVVGETLFVDNVAIATVATVGQPIFSQRAQIVGGNNPFNAQYVDRQGAAAVRFAEGSTQFDGFGRMIMSEPRTLGDYQMPYGIDPKMWHVEEIGTGAVTYVSDSVGALLSTGLADGDIARLTTQNYHPYQAGTGQLILLTGFSEDTGKAGVVRRWGYFDDEDGVFFQIDGNGLAAVVRTSTTGVVTETVIPQSNWNTDPLDGTGQSQFALNVTKHNLYWIDFAWLGIGAIRFGVFGEDGSRIVAHMVQNANMHQAPYMRTARLPIRYEVENTTAQATISEFFASCCSVKIEGEYQPRHRPFGGSSLPPKTITGSTRTPIFGVRAAATHYGLPNRVMVMPQDMDILAYLTGTDTPAKVRVFWMRQPTGLSGATWTPTTVSADSSVEYDPASTGTPAGETVMASLVNGEKTIELHHYFDVFSDERVSLRSDGTATEYYLCAVPVDPTDSVDVVVSLNWTEV